MLIAMTYAPHAQGSRKTAELTLRYEPVKREMPFLIVGQPLDDLPIIRL